MKETVMKKVFAVVVGFLMVLMFSGVALCSDAAPAAKQKSVKKSSAAVVKAPYVSVQGGVAFLTDSDLSDTRSGAISFDDGYALGVAVGYKLGKIRAEGEIGYQKNEVDQCDSSCRSVSGDMKAYTFLVNGYYDFVNKTRLMPYIWNRYRESGCRR
jgi:opacity protein-like surface antigen